MKELYEGARLTMKELADWFGIQPKTLRSNKEKKLAILGDFADFSIEETGEKKKHTVVIINEVYCPVYSKAIDIIREKRDQYRDPMHTGVDRDNLISERLYKNEPVVRKTIQKDTCYKYCSSVARERYGKIYDKESRGTVGYRYPVWAKKEYDEKIGSYYRQLTTEEYQKLQKAKEEAKLFSDDKWNLMMTEFRKKYGNSGKILRKSDREEALEDFEQLIQEVKAQNWDTFEKKCYESLGFIPDSAIKEIKSKDEVRIIPMSV